MNTDDDYEIECDLCSQSYSSYAMLEAHYESDHAEHIRHCKTCGANYPKDAYHRC